MAFVKFLHFLLLSIWIGGITIFSFVVAPAVFRMSPTREEAGKIFIHMFSQPHLNWMKQATEDSNAHGCYLVVDERFLATWNLTQLRWILGKEVLSVDDVHIWRYDSGYPAL